MSLQNTQSLGFTKRAIYRPKSPEGLKILSHKTSFWIATFSVFAFVVGNLVGQHGWYAVYKSVLGNGLESQVVYNGTVAPIAKVPNYEVWARYGGDSRKHTYRQIPANALMDLPLYSASLQNSSHKSDQYDNTFTVGFAGSYATGGHGDGYHVGTDIAVPRETPVLSMMNGIVTFVGEKYGYGNIVVVKHPNVPDPKNASNRVTLYSSYAHLQSAIVTEGEVVQKGQQIAYSGESGNVTGPHLHVQLDYASAPFIPFWPNDHSTSSVLAYSIDPITYAQAHQTAVPQQTTVARNNVRTTTRSVLGTTYRTTVTRRSAPDLQALQEQRLQSRLLRRRTGQTRTTTPVVTSSSVANQAQPAQTQEVATIDIRHDRHFTDGEWEEVRLIAQDENGNTISNPSLPRGVYLKTAFGTAEFSTPIVQQADFVNGEATVQMRSLEKRTVVIEVQPFGVISTPLTYESR